MEKMMTINEINNLFPNEWILLGNPVMDEWDLDVLQGIPIFHSKDKKEVCYIGRDKKAGYDTFTLLYTGTVKPARIITGIFNRTENNVQV